MFKKEVAYRKIKFLEYSSTYKKWLLTFSAWQDIILRIVLPHRNAEEEEMAVTSQGGHEDPGSQEMKGLGTVHTTSA